MNSEVLGQFWGVRMNLGDFWMSFEGFWGGWGEFGGSFERFGVNWGGLGLVRAVGNDVEGQSPRWASFRAALPR